MVTTVLIGALAACAPLQGLADPIVLRAPDPSPAEIFGRSVAIDGDVLAVSSYELWSSTHPVGPGSVYVFERHGGAWQLAQRLDAPFASDDGSGYEFGAALDLAGDTLVVGWPNKWADSDVGPETADHGSVHLYRRAVGGGWDEVGRADRLTWSAGTAVELTADSVFVGAPSTIPGWGGVTFGRVDEYDLLTLAPKQGGVSWLDPYSPIHDCCDWFGHSIACVDGTLVVGAPELNEYSLWSEFIDPGIWIYDLPPGDAPVVLSGPHNGLQFGRCLAYDGTTIVADADLSSVQGGHRLLLFEEQGGAWGEVFTLTMSSFKPGLRSDNLALSGDLVLAGSDYAGAGAEGQVFVVRRETGGMFSLAALIDNPLPGARFGHALAASGQWLAVAADTSGLELPAVCLYDLGPLID